MSRSSTTYSDSGVNYKTLDPANREGFKRVLGTHKEFRKLVRGAATARLG